MGEITPPPLRTQAAAQAIRQSGIDWHHSATKMGEFALGLEQECAALLARAELAEYDASHTKDQNELLFKKIAELQSELPTAVKNHLATLDNEGRLNFINEVMMNYCSDCGRFVRDGENCKCWNDE